ncbi:MAG TPA: Asp-tRNA(Asn)/Glu-tRNA(Gln) amidotransferase subunit GatB [Dehalococcoidia bacterium]|nr:Asp-tRNA(Asn)/Glu-tRNA(Gln) amidotransferase subunit GatB [Dehalococcoidia bacterium]
MTIATETGFEVVIGLEVHSQLSTRSKMFCGCSTDYSGAEPNTHVCPVCLALPGVLPVINERAIELIAMTGLALNCGISEHAKFDRKNYLYPDLMKGYQISQYDQPICVGGWLEVTTDEGTRRILINRVHMEEDTARLVHRTDRRTGESYSLVDVNRSGTPLMEIVSEPDIRTAEEARDYLVRLRQILRYIGVSNANMEEGNFRCDANISLRPVGATELGTKVEIKNMNSFRAVYDALLFEEQRQSVVLGGGGRIEQETRGWDDERGVTTSQRTKEFAHDYRYFPEPDLPPLRLSREWVDRLRTRLPELPEARKERLLAHDLSDHEASLLTESRDRADYFEAVKGALPLDDERAAKLAANWVLGEVGRWSNDTGREVSEVPIEPAKLAELITIAHEGKITGASAKQVFERMLETGDSAKKVVENLHLGQISGSDELRQAARDVIKNNEQAVTDYRAGKETAIKFLLGQVMRETRGRANPQMVQELLKEELG